MTESAYSKKLKDPRWQKKRLEILERDEWSCQFCFGKDDTLHVHHWYYTYGKEPWDYPDAALTTLCEACHTAESEERKEAETGLLHSLRVGGLSATDLNVLGEAFVTQEGKGHELGLVAYAVYHLLNHPGLISRTVHDAIEEEGRILAAVSRKWNCDGLSERHLVYSATRNGHSLADLMVLVDLCASWGEWHREMVALVCEPVSTE